MCPLKTRLYYCISSEMHKMWLQKGEGDRLYPVSMADVWGKIARERCVGLESFLRNSEALK